MYNYSRTLPFNRTRFANDFKRVHHTYERSVISLFQNALKAQVKPVIAYIRENGVEHLPSHLTTLVSPVPMAEAYKKCYVKIGVQNAEWTQKWIRKIVGKKDIGFFGALWRKLMENFFLTDSSQRVAMVTETTRERIKKALAEAKEQNLSTSETATYLENTLKSDDFTRARALTIARTESTTAANKGALLAADSSDYLVGKGWIPILDRVTRPDHAAMADYEVIALDEYFNVGGSIMAYPGDSNAPAKQIVNCRCSLVIIPLADSDGLPILKYRQSA